MSKLIDLTGQRFGRLTVLEKDENRKSKTGSYWVCKCDCGNIKSVRSASLREGAIRSCGCYRKDFLSELKAENLIGAKFGKLTVIGRSLERSSDNRIKWICECECGNQTTVTAHDLKSFHTLSCGCNRKSFGEQIITKILLDNNINFIPQYCFSDLKRRFFDFAIFDKENKLKQLIEFDGEQHFVESHYFKEALKERQKRDKEKNEYALKNNIPLIRIPYTEKKNITLEKILTKEVLENYGKL